jgi:hypothetical protein
VRTLTELCAMQLEGDRPVEVEGVRFSLPTGSVRNDRLFRCDLEADPFQQRNLADEGGRADDGPCARRYADGRRPTRSMRDTPLNG